MNLRLVVIALAAFAIGAVAAIGIIPGARERLFAPLQTVVTGKALIGGPFSLVGHTGKRVTDKDYRGRYMLVFFGYTFCPDVCPAGLQVMTEALERIGPEKAKRVQPLFISVDPERDTPEQLALYVKSFHPSLVGLTGTPDEIAAAARAYRAIYRRVKDEKSKAGYSVDHSTFFYLMDPNGEFVTHFTHATPVDVLAEKLAKTL